MATDLTVANTIAEQLGSGTLFMIGATNLVGYPDALGFRFKMCKKFNHIKIALDKYDTYQVTFTKIVGFEIKATETFEGIYCDQLHSLIERTTGLATRMPKVIFK